MVKAWMSLGTSAKLGCFGPREPLNSQEEFVYASAFKPAFQMSMPGARQAGSPRCHLLSLPSPSVISFPDALGAHTRLFLVLFIRGGAGAGGCVGLKRLVKQDPNPTRAPSAWRSSQPSARFILRMIYPSIWWDLL